LDLASWTNFLGIVEHFEGSLLSWVKHWGKPNVNPSLAWWVEVRSTSFLLQSDNVGQFCYNNETSPKLQSMF